MPSLSIIIVNYKSWGILQKNLELLSSYDFENINLQIIVVDNCSNDGRLAEFISLFSKVLFVENEGNWGFAHGCNCGAELATGDILLFLNPDTLAPKASLEKMLFEYISDSKIGILSCKQSDKPSAFRKITPSIFSLFGPQRSLYVLLFPNKFKENNCLTCTGDAISPDWISGSVVMISRAWFDRVGGWNTDYWMYFEDVEFSIKVKQAGGELRMLCGVNIVHEHGGASRINVETAALTKSEVIISHHVYIQNNFSALQKIPSHVLLVINTLFFKSILGILGCFLFFIPKASLQVLLFRNILKYYWSALRHQTWLSFRSFKFDKR